MRGTAARTLASTLASLWILAMPAAASSYDDAFSKLKTLVGTWDVEGEDGQVTYALTGRGGGTVIERFTGETTMSTFYHRDGDALRLTHYCSAGNQPRLKAVGYDPKTKRLEFGFVDVTNLASPDTYYTRGLEIRFADTNRIVLGFTGVEDGETTVSSVTLIRRAD